MKAIMFPGQGSQYKGMGKTLFPKYRKETMQASEILGYDLEELCVHDPRKELSKTQFTQPALYVVNALTYYDEVNGSHPDFLIGHSLGEYNALHAAGVFDFETGLRLVQKRGALMAAASGGTMAAIMGLDVEELKAKLKAGGYDTIDVANYNSPSQIVIAGPQKDIDKVCSDFDSQGIRAVVLNVTAPFHSRYMKPASQEFYGFLEKFRFADFKVPVISNTTARPYESQQVVELLSRQIASPVNWIDTIRLLMGKGVKEYREVGSGILTKMMKEVTARCTPLKIGDAPVAKEETATNNSLSVSAAPTPPNALNDREQKMISTNLGSQVFREAYGIKYAYMAGAMYRGIASKELVVLMGKAGLMGFVGTGGLSLPEIENNIKFIQQELKGNQSYGMNLLYNLYDKEVEMETVKLYLRYGVQRIEAAAFMQITLPLVYFRLKGLKKNAQGQVVCTNKIIAKVSRPEVAEVFMRPAPERLVTRLLDMNLITEEEAAMAHQVPVSHDICVEADSGGHTDGGIAMVLLPSIQQLSVQVQKEFQYNEPIRVGLAGGIGTPQAVACAFIMGADFVLTGSINQCTVEAGTSDTVKDLLQQINVQDTDYAPAGDMFEIGAKIQVLKKGVLFPARANKLYALYQRYDSLDEIPQKTIAQLEGTYFKKNIPQIWEETKQYFIRKGQQEEVTESEQNPRKKMALVFRWYFSYSNQLAFEGNADEKVNFQIHTGPALGAFNQWVKGTEWENWRNRHADAIGIRLMEDAAVLLEKTFASIIPNQ